MPDSKVSALTALTGANVATDDILYIGDTSAGTAGSKKITVAELVIALKAKLGTTLFDHYTSVGNIDAGEDDLYTDTLVANQLSTNGEKLELIYGGTLASGMSTRQLKFKFAGTVMLDSNMFSVMSATTWTARITIVRVNSTTIRFTGILVVDGLMSNEVMVNTGEITGLTLSNTNIVKITGEASTTDDIVATIGTIRWLPAA